MRRKGQHFLVDASVISRMADYADLRYSDSVLEVGPGTGNLTRILAERAKSVYAVEVDPALAEDLRGRYSNVEVIRGDALKVELPSCNKIVSNLPYQISSQITYRFLKRPFDLAVLMYQREFAQRMLALPGEEMYGRLGMAVGCLCRAEILERIPRTAWRPVPQVDSGLVRLRPMEVDVDAGRFLGFVEGLFRERRKKTRNALASMGFSLEAMQPLDAEMLERRPEELSPEEAAHILLTLDPGSKRERSSTQ
jgi:16S rRNA (adenine1518-N6/adenine1519-N6)-dimethyltransferase